MSSSKKNKQYAASAKFNSYPFWAPRFWSGMRLGTWTKLLLRNRLRISPLRLPMVLSVSLSGSFCSLTDLRQRMKYSRRIAETRIDKPPVFVLGHWRSGTTYLHELLDRDDRFAAPTTFQVYSPHHFLLSESMATRFLSFLVPTRRPMDDMKVGMGSPQEDEWGLCTMGVPTPYLRVVFPNDPPPFMDYLELENLPDQAIAQWKEAFLLFLKMVTMTHGKRLVLKSPPHMGRLKVLLDLFPDAKFVHIVRNPYVVFPSTVRMWQSFDKTQALQRPNLERLEEFVFIAHDRLYRSFEQRRSLLAANQICDIRYEDLVSNPLEEMQRVYQTLELGEFEAASTNMKELVAGKEGYQPNRYELDDALCKKIEDRWGEHIAQYGYQAVPG